MVKRVILLLCLLVILSAIILFREMKHTQTRVDKQRELIQGEKKAQVKTYIRKSVQRYRQRTHDDPSVMSTQETETAPIESNDVIAEQTQPPEDADVVVVDRNPTYAMPSEPNGPKSLTQEKMDDVVNRLEMIEIAPDPTYRSRLVEIFKKEIQVEMEKDPQSDFYHSVMDEIDRISDDSSALPSEAE